MASFGRLDIYRPGSTVENFIISKDVTAVGRQIGNDLVVDREGVSRYHIMLKFVDGQMVLEDLESVNGTYVDGMRIQPTDPRILRGGEEIQIGDVRLVYQAHEPLPDTEPVSTVDTTQHLVTEQLMVHISGPDMVVVPGSHAQASILLENLTEEPERYRLSVAGVPKEWVRLDRREVELDPGSQIQVMASFKPQRRSETTPGNYPLTFAIAPTSDEDEKIEVESVLQIGAYSGLGIVMGTEVVEGKAPFHFFVHNHGNAPLDLNFRGADPANALSCSILPPNITLDAGERRKIEGYVKPRKETWFGAPREYPYDVIAFGQNAAGFQAAVTGRFVSRPLLPSWMATLIIPLVAVVGVGLVVIIAMLFDASRQPVVPQILSFTVVGTDQDVELGSPVSLQWEVVDARSVTLSYGRPSNPNQPPQELLIEDPTTTTYQLILETTGIYAVTLIVENSGGRKSEVLLVNVLPRIDSLTANPSALKLDVNQSITLSWSFDGAELVNGLPNVMLESPELSTIQGAELPQQGSEEYLVRPTSSTVSIRLRVTGNDGTENSLTYNFAVEAPRCNLSNPQGIVYEGPGLNYHELGVIEGPDAFVNPHARDILDTWLQIDYEDAPAWVRAADFTCVDFSTDQLDPELDVPPSPTPLPTETPTSTPTFTVTPLPTGTPVPTDTPTPRPTRTRPPTRVPTRTPRPSPTGTPES